MSMQIYQRLYPTAPIIDKQIALVATQFNAHIVECLLKDTLATLKKEGIAEGKIWPGCTKSCGVVCGLLAVRIVLARSAQEIPVLTPFAASIDTVKLV